MRARTATRLGALVLGLGAGTAMAQARPDLGAIATRGDAAWESQNHDAAFAAYDSVVRADSAASSRAVYRLGTLKSWRNQFRDAIALHQLYVRLEPRDLEGKVGLGRVYAYASQFPIDLLNVSAVIFVLATTWPVARRLGLAYAVFILINMLPPLAAGGLLSAGRFSSVLFPAFVWFAHALPARQRPGWLAGFMAVQALNAALFYTWRPMY